MVGEPATLEFLARQQDRILAELASLRDDFNVLTAIVQRLDNNSTRLLAEIRATIAKCRCGLGHGCGRVSRPRTAASGNPAGSPPRAVYGEGRLRRILL